MFTGIITDLGTIQSLESNNQDIRIKVMVSKLDMQDVSIGDSIATNGVCLTVVEFDSNSFSADVSPETISRTSFHDYKVGDQVNLEKALLVSDRLGGHIVSGHVDGLGKIISMIQQGRWMDVWIEPEKNLNRYIAEKGSITVDGVSLTVNEVSDSQFRLTLIPQTLKETIFHKYSVGSYVNLEVDLLARYIERLIKTSQHTSPKSELTYDVLAQNGFVKN